MRTRNWRCRPRNRSCLIADGAVWPGDEVALATKLVKAPFDLAQRKQRLPWIWARHWMDLIRYAESRGHESDYPIANAYQYRDYLIRAYNVDVPYADFVREQIAGDLLPQPRLNPVNGANESVLGTGWVFLGEEVHSPVRRPRQFQQRISARNVPRIALAGQRHAVGERGSGRKASWTPGNQAAPGRAA
jgi:hypothetical protein